MDSYGQLWTYLANLDLSLTNGLPFGFEFFTTDFYRIKRGHPFGIHSAAMMGDGTTKEDPIVP